MEYQELEKLTYQYADALGKEYILKFDAIDAQAGIERIKTRIIKKAAADGQIDGGNADTRKIQRAAAVANAPGATEARAILKQAELAAAMAEIERKRLDALVGLTKAWLYSQKS